MLRLKNMDPPRGIAWPINHRAGLRRSAPLLTRSLTGGPIACSGDSPARPASQQGRVRDPRHPRRLRARRGDGLGDPADLRHEHLQAGRRRRAARRLRVQPLRQPDAHRPRGQHRRAGGGRARVRLRQRPGRRGHRHPGAVPTWRPRAAARRRVRRHVPALRQGRHCLGAAARPGSRERPRRRPRRAPAGGDAAGVGRDADQPAAQHRRHRGHRLARARRGRAARGRQHLRHAVPPDAADPGRRRGAALHDQVRRRALRRRRRRRRREGPRAGRADRLPPERDGRGGGAVRRVAGAAGPEDARRPHGPPLRQRRAGGGVPEPPRSGLARLLPGSARAPRATTSRPGR